MKNCVVVSLERANERLDKIKEQFNKINKSFVHYVAFDGKNILNPTFTPSLSLKGGYRNGDKFKLGEIGCILSHIGVISMAKSLNWEYVIILEDDIVISDDFDKRITQLFKLLPSNWEHTYISGNPHTQPGISHKLLHIENSITTDGTFAYILHSRAYDKVLTRLSAIDSTVDDMYNNMINNKTLLSYTLYPFCVYVNNDYSYIWETKSINKHNSYKFFVNKL